MGAPFLTASLTALLAAPSIFWLSSATPPPAPPSIDLPSLTPASAHVITIAGSGQRGHTDGQGELAQFNWPTGVAVGPDWIVYVADYANHLIRKISPDGLVTTLAGSGEPGWLDGAGAEARFHGPDGIVLAPSGDLYVADADNRRIRKVAPDGTVTTVAGSGQAGGRNGPAMTAQFLYPTGIAVDGAGALYVADRGAHTIRKITPTGLVSTLAGSGRPGYTDGMGTAAQFHDPMTVVSEPSGRLFVADSGSHAIRMITPDGRVSTVTGSPHAGAADGANGAAQFNWPTGLARDQAGNLYVADSNNALIRKISPDGQVTTLAGVGHAGSDDGPGSAAGFHFPTGVAVDRQGDVYVADSANNLIRRISPGLRLFTACCDRTTQRSALHGSGPPYYTGLSILIP